MADLTPDDNLLHRIERRLRGYAPQPLNHSRPEAGVLLALTGPSVDPHIILTQRAQHLSSHSGEVAFPGGKKDEEDDSLEVTALREAHEEIGLEPEQVRIISPLNPCLSKHGLVVTPYVGVISSQVSLQPNPQELDSLFTVPLRFFMDPDQLSVDRLRHRGQVLHMPRFRYQGYQIWGLTAYILVELLNYGLGAQIPLRPRPEMLNQEEPA